MSSSKYGRVEMSRGVQHWIHGMLGGRRARHCLGSRLFGKLVVVYH